jgi:hypothetical protein
VTHMHTLLVVLFALTPVSQAWSAPAFYTDETAFLAAVTAPPLVESFEALADGTPAPFSTASGITVSNVGTSSVDITTASDAVSDGAKAVGCVFSGGGELTFDFPTPIFAFGTDVNDLGTLGSTTLTLTTTTGSQVVFLDFTGPSGNLLFAGVVDPAGFTSVTFSNTSTADFAGFDRVQFLAPSAIPALGPVGLGLIACALVFSGWIRLSGAATPARD